MNNKKGQAMPSSVSSFIFLILGIGVVVILMILFGVMNGSVYQTSESITNTIGVNRVANYSITFAVPNQTYYLGHYAIHTGTVRLLNGTANIGVGNLTINYDTGYAYTTKNLWNNTAIKVSYYWGAKEIQTNYNDMAMNGFQTMENTSNYTNLVVLALIIGMIFSIILGFGYLGSSGMGFGKGGSL